MLWNFWSILCESALFILVGFLVAAILDVLLTGRKIIESLSGTGARSVFLATLIGAPLPLCSCSVLPTAVTLRKRGAGKGATLSFLVSTPETSITSVLLTYALLGPLMAVFRPIAACLTALTAGLVENAVEQRFPSPTDEPAESNCDCSPPESGGAEISTAATSLSSHLREKLRYAFVNLFDDLFAWIMLGIVVAAAIQAWLPPEVLNRILGGELQSMLLMVLIGVPLYVCAEGSTPIAAALIAQGVSPGAAIVFLLVGPATNIGSLGVLHRQLGRRTVIVYLATIIVVSLLMGLVANAVFGGQSAGLQARMLDEPLLPIWLKYAGALAFLAIGAGSIWRQRYFQRLADWLDTKLPVPVSPRGLLFLLGVIMVAAYAASGFYIVRPGEVGIVRRFGAVQRSDAGPGWHYALPYPIDQADRVPVNRVRRTVIGFQRDPEGGIGQESDPKKSWILIGDENVADIKTTVHWGVDANQIVRFQFGVADRETLVQDVVLAAMREVLSGMSINTILTSTRQQCEQEIESLAQQRLDDYKSGMRIYSFRILDAHAPPDVHASFRDVASALEDRSTQIHQARAEEARLVPLARGRANWKLAEAYGYAARTVLHAKGQADRFLELLQVYSAWPEVTGRRMEFEMLDQVWPKLWKYIKPPAAEIGELEIWFVEPGAVDKLPVKLPGR